MNSNNNFYVYLYWKKDTMKVFHVGKGKELRRFSKDNRNRHFKSICEKHEVFVTIHSSHLTEEEAWNLEEELIYKYKLEGQAETNYHKGGSGGNTLMWDESGELKEQMIKKCREASLGEKNPMFGKSFKDVLTEDEWEQWLEKRREISKEIGQRSECKKLWSKASKELWSREGYKEQYRNKNSRKMYRYDDGGKLLETYPSIYEALDFLGLKNHTTLLKHIRQGTKYKNYYWKREEKKGVTTIESIS